MVRTWMFVFLLLVLLLGGCAPLATPSRVAEEAAAITPDSIIELENDGIVRILFIGNTHTSINKGLDAHLAAMAASADLPFDVETGSIAQPGVSLDELWANGDAVETIRQEEWDVVILQAADTKEPEEFRTAVKQFADLIVASDALPALLALRDTNGEREQSIEQIAADLSLPLINPARAWAEAEIALPDLPLEDAQYQGYPSIAGTYLDTASLYARALWPES